MFHAAAPVASRRSVEEDQYLGIANSECFFKFCMKKIAVHLHSAAAAMLHEDSCAVAWDLWARPAQPANHCETGGEEAVKKSLLLGN